MGEPSGVGGELTLKAWHYQHSGLPCFAALDDPERLKQIANGIGLDVPVRLISHPKEAAEVFPKALPVLAETLPAASSPGLPNPANAPAVCRSIERAVTMALSGDAAGVVTNPIQKSTLYDAGFTYPGHTEFLAALSGEGVRPVMMLACDALKAVPVTIHMSLKDAIEALSADEIFEIGVLTDKALRRDFAIDRPRLAISGLNPHAGEEGAMGTEDQEIVAPAVRRLQAKGIDARGPLPADTMFNPRARAGYDAALCMYHDQALIPVKTLDFDGAVNVTLGLPFIRTSPDHGTALDIAGTGQARPDSLIAAIRMAAALATNRAAAQTSA